MQVKNIYALYAVELLLKNRSLLVKNVYLRQVAMLQPAKSMNKRPKVLQVVVMKIAGLKSKFLSLLLEITRQNLKKKGMR